jgi:hypothetical protein
MVVTPQFNGGLSFNIPKSKKKKKKKKNETSVLVQGEEFLEWPTDWYRLMKVSSIEKAYVDYCSTMRHKK